MRFIADENVPLPSVRLLRKAGHDVLAIASESPGMEDSDVMDRARQEGRILLTLDSDYHQMVFTQGQGGPAGIVHFRIVPQSPHVPGQRLIDLINVGTQLDGQFTTITSQDFAQEQLPGNP